MTARGLYTERGDWSAKNACVALCVIAVLGVALRVAVTLMEPMGWNDFSDDNAYLSSAATFAKTGYVTYATPSVRSAVLGAGMPLVLGHMLLLFGYQRAGLEAAHIAFSLIGVLTGYGAYLWGKLLRGRRAGVLAAALVTLDLGMISTNCVFYTETPYMCLNLFALYFFTTCVKPWRVGRYIAGAACLCAAASFKGLALLAPVCALPLVWAYRVPLRRWLPKALALAAIFVLAFAPWSLRNRLMNGELTPFPISQGDQKLLGSYEGLGCPEGDYASDTMALDAKAWTEGYQSDRTRRLADRGELASERYAAWLRQDPLGFVATHLVIKPVKLLSGAFYPARVLGAPKRAVRLFLWLCLALAAFGALPQRGARRERLVPLIYIVAAVYITAYYIPIDRYNAPHVPLIMLFAAIGLDRLAAAVAARRASRPSLDFPTPPEYHDPCIPDHEGGLPE